MYEEERALAHDLHVLACCMFSRHQGIALVCLMLYLLGQPLILVSRKSNMCLFVLRMCSTCDWFETKVKKNKVFQFTPMMKPQRVRLCPSLSPLQFRRCRRRCCCHTAGFLQRQLWSWTSKQFPSLTYSSPDLPTTFTPLFSSRHQPHELPI